MARMLSCKASVAAESHLPYTNNLFFVFLFASDNSCPNPGSPQFGRQANLVVFPASPGSVLNFVCNPGFTLNGSETAQCAATGRWSTEVPPRCEGEFTFRKFIFFLFPRIPSVSIGRSFGSLTPVFIFD